MRAWVSALWVLSACSPRDGGGLNAVMSTSVPFLLDGRDEGHRVLVHLANYSSKVQPTFGPDGDAEVEVDGDGVTVHFHPTHSHQDTGDHGAPDQYFLYVGLMAPPMSEDADGNVYAGGMAERPSVKDAEVRFQGEFRFDRGDAAVRKHLYLTPTFMYFNADGSEYKQIAFNDYGGLENRPAESLFFDHEAFGWSTGWRNVYWGDWWDDDLCAPGADAEQASDWIPFDMDLTSASDRAVQWANAEWRDREAPDPYFNTDHVELWGAYLGPEYAIGEGELTFSVRKLNLVLQPR